MEKRTTQRIEGLVWVGLGIALLFGSIRLGLGSLQSPGTGFASFIGGALLAVFGLILALFSPGENLPQEIGKAIFTRAKLRQPLLALLILFSYPFLLKVLGFVLSTFLFLFFLFKAMEPRKWFTLLIISLGGSLASYLIFQVWLRVSFPKGMIGIG